MTQTVWKYEIKSWDLFLDLPLDSHPLSVEIQDGIVVMWVLVNPQETFMITRRFIVVETGEFFTQDSVEFIQTIMVHNHNIYHVFEVK